MKICRFCGKKLLDEAMFCRYCGKSCNDMAQDDDSGQKQEIEQKENQEDEQGHDTGRAGKKKKSLLPVIVGGIALMAVAAGGSFLALKHGDPERVSGIFEEKQAEADEWFDLSQAELIENYTLPEDGAIIDLAAHNHQPSARDISSRWDKGLFYWLEDIGGDDDNHIADCILTRMELKRAESGTPIKYEVYREPQSGEIQKIVSIEKKEDGSLELSDYYYREGKPDFVFRRSDYIYTPSYATIDKTGERYYFSEDQMVKWRWIYEPSVVKQWILELEDTWYTQWSYGDISEAEQREYDEKEDQILNEAYNTYEAILANEPVFLIQGRVTDESGNPLEGVEVGIGKILEGEIQKPKVKVITDQSGTYAWAVEEAEGEENTGGQEYFLVFCKEGWAPSLMKVSDVGTEYEMQQMDQDDMVLCEQGEEEYKVAFYTCQVEAQDQDDVLKRAFSEDEREEAVPALAGATIKVYSGVNWFFKTPVAEEESSPEGKAEIELPAGVYTAVVEKEGILPARKVFLAGGKEQEQVIYAMTKGGEESAAKEGMDDEWRILLSWDVSDTAPLDLDSSLFTPDKADRGDRNCINTLNRSDNAGAKLLYDGEGYNACEIITLTVPKRGSYKYYVSNYTDIQSGNTSSRSLSESGAKVTVFHNGIPVRTFSVPEKAGSVWEVFELRNQGIVPIQEVYESTEGKEWWTEDKKLAWFSERSLMPGWIQSDGEWLYFVNWRDEGKLYYCRKDGSDMTKFCDDPVQDGRILLVGEYLYYLMYNKNSNGKDGFVYTNLMRIKNDGTERTVLCENIPQADIEMSDGVHIMGYADGMLYYYNSSEVACSSSALRVDGQEADPSVWPSQVPGVNGTVLCSYGQTPGKTMVVGDYLYYLDGSKLDYEPHSFCRKNLKNGAEECLKSGVNWHPWSWRIYKGWIYYTEHGIIKRTKLRGTGSLTEEQILADNGIECESRFMIELGNTDYEFQFFDNTCYYLGADEQMHSMDLDGGKQKIVSPLGDTAILLDGEFYTMSASDGWSILARDRNGENKRWIFDVVPLMNQAALREYARYLESYVPEVFLIGEGSQYNMGPDFACQDIDHDGIYELFVSYGYYRDSYIDYYDYEYNRYGNGWFREKLKEQPSTGTAINMDGKEIVLEDQVGNYHVGVSRFRFDGGLIQEVYFYPNATNEGLEDFEYAYDTYMKPYPILKFVENTSENRQKYLLGGLETGWIFP